jgi:hypothetical protein
VLITYLRFLDSAVTLPITKKASASGAISNNLTKEKDHGCYSAVYALFPQVLWPPLSFWQSQLQCPQ